MTELNKIPQSNTLLLDDTSRPSSSASKGEHHHRAMRGTQNTHGHPNMAVPSPRSGIGKKNTIRLTGKDSQPNSSTSVVTPTKPKPKDDLPTILNTQRRTITQANILYKAIQEFEFLKKFRDENSELNDDEAIIHLCQNLGYEVHEGGSVIFREGDVANEKMYLVYSGEAIIVRRQADFYTMKNLQAAQEKLEEPEKTERTEKSEMKSSHKAYNKLGSTVLDSNKGISKMGSQTNIDSARTGDSNPTDQMTSPRNLISSGQPSMGEIPQNRPSKYKKMQTNNLVVDTERVREEEEDDLIFDLDSFVKKFGTVVDTMKKGRFFGDKALVSNAPRAASVITGCRSEFLTISATLFKHLKAKFEKTTRNKLNFLMDHFPSMDSVTNQKTVEFLLYIMEEKIYQFHNIVINEDTKGNNIFIIVKGSCDVFKKKPGYQEGLLPETASQSLHKTHIFVCSIHAGVFFGEEILFKKDSFYDYTIRASSADLVIYAIEKSKFLLRFPYMSIEGMKVFAAQQKAHFESLYQKGLAGSEMIEKSLKFKHAKNNSIQLKAIKTPRTENFNMDYNSLEKSKSPDIAERHETPVSPQSRLIMLSTSKTKTKILRGHAGHLHALDKMYSDELLRPSNPSNKPNIKEIKEKLKKEKFDFGIPEDSPHYKKFMVTHTKKLSQSRLLTVPPEMATPAQVHSSMAKLTQSVQMPKIHNMPSFEVTTQPFSSHRSYKKTEGDFNEVTSVRTLRKKIQDINHSHIKNDENISITKPIFLNTEISGGETLSKFALPEIVMGRGSEVDMLEIMNDRFSMEKPTLETMDLTNDSKLLFTYTNNTINSYMSRGQSHKVSNLRTKWINMQKIKFPNSGLTSYLETLKSTSNVVESIFVPSDSTKGNTSRTKPSNLGITSNSDQLKLNKTRSENTFVKYA